MPGRRSRTWPCCACGRKSWLSAIYSASGGALRVLHPGGERGRVSGPSGRARLHHRQGRTGGVSPDRRQRRSAGHGLPARPLRLDRAPGQLRLSILGGVLLGSLVIAALVASRLQKSITEPLGAVATVARAVMQQRDFQLAGAAQSWRDRGTGGGLQ
ncbi:hypothetical protein LP420_02550 [Massilia sp. B-10]|nr:hypothetical protein LP420_02550 [Massilia sp. B-10]